MKLLTVTESARKSGLSTALIRRAAQDGKIDGAQQIGGSWTFTRDAFDDWYSTRRKPGNPEWTKTEPAE